MSAGRVSAGGQAAAMLVAAPSAGGAAVPDVLKQFDRVCRRPLWPEFEPCRIPLAGKHPLFQGIRRATVPLASAPRIEETPETVKISGEGMTLEFRGAGLSRSDQTLTVTLPRSPALDHPIPSGRAIDNGVQRRARPHRFGHFFRVWLIVTAEVHGSALGTE
jgi:hypothetical protein